MGGSLRPFLCCALPVLTPRIGIGLSPPLVTQSIDDVLHGQHRADEALVAFADGLLVVETKVGFQLEDRGAFALQPQIGLAYHPSPRLEAEPVVDRIVLLLAHSRRYVIQLGLLGLTLCGRRDDRRRVFCNATIAIIM